MAGPYIIDAYPNCESNLGSTYKINIDRSILLLDGQVHSGELKISDNDTTLGKLYEKVVSGTGISITVQNEGGDESLVISGEFASQAQAEAGTDNTVLMTPLRVAQAVPALFGEYENKILQYDCDVFSAVATGTTQIPVDDTIPQKTEGDQYVTKTFAPSASGNTVYIFGSLHLQSNNNTDVKLMTAAVFIDDEPDAIGGGANYKYNIQDSGQQIGFFAQYTTTGTEEVTFKVRAGYGAAGTTTFNGFNGSRRFGGMPQSHICIMEVAP